MTPVLFLLSIGCYFVKSYPMFYVEMVIYIIALIWIIWFQSKGKKFENNVHEFVWNKSRYNKVEIDVQGIKLEDKKICELKEIDRVFLHKGFFFLITNEKKLLVLKTVGVETEELIKIIKEADILFEKREEPSINEQISNFAQTYPTNLKASSNEALLFMRRYRFANCSCFSCCFKDAYPSSNVQ